MADGAIALMAWDQTIRRLAVGLTLVETYRRLLAGQFGGMRIVQQIEDIGRAGKKSPSGWFEDAPPEAQLPLNQLTACGAEMLSLEPDPTTVEAYLALVDQGRHEEAASALEVARVDCRRRRLDEDWEDWKRAERLLEVHRTRCFRKPYLDSYPIEKSVHPEEPPSWRLVLHRRWVKACAVLDAQWEEARRRWYGKALATWKASVTDQQRAALIEYEELKQELDCYTNVWKSADLVEEYLAILAEGGQMRADLFTEDLLHQLHEMEDVWEQEDYERQQRAEKELARRAYHSEQAWREERARWLADLSRSCPPDPPGPPRGYDYFHNFE